MSLSDRYNRGGGGRLDNLDRYLTHLGDRVGNFWLDRTGASRHLLTQGLYLFAIWAALQNLVMFRNHFMVIIAGLAFFGLLGITQSRGGLVEQIQVEAMRLPKSTFAFLRIFILFVGFLALARASGTFGAAVVDRTAVPWEAAEACLKGCALVALQAGEYIRRTNPPTISSSGRGMGI